MQDNYCEDIICLMRNGLLCRPNGSTLIFLLSTCVIVLGCELGQKLEKVTELG